MKKLLGILLGIILIIGLTGCNAAVFDTNYTYDRAIIHLANDEVIEVEIKTWCDYDGEQLQIEAKDGTIYLTNSFRCDLINDKEGKRR